MEDCLKKPRLVAVFFSHSTEYVHWKLESVAWNLINIIVIRIVWRGAYRTLSERHRIRTMNMFSLFLFCAFLINSGEKCWLCSVPIKPQYQWGQSDQSQARLHQYFCSINYSTPFFLGPTPLTSPPVSDVTCVHTWHILHDSEAPAHVCAPGWQQETVYVL